MITRPAKLKSPTDVFRAVCMFALGREGILALTRREMESVKQLHLDKCIVIIESYGREEPDWDPKAEARLSWDYYPSVWKVMERMKTISPEYYINPSGEVKNGVLRGYFRYESNPLRWNDSRIGYVWISMNLENGKVIQTKRINIYKNKTRKEELESGKVYEDIKAIPTWPGVYTVNVYKRSGCSVHTMSELGGRTEKMTRDNSLPYDKNWGVIKRGDDVLGIPLVYPLVTTHNGKSTTCNYKIPDNLDENVGMSYYQHGLRFSCATHPLPIGGNRYIMMIKSKFDMEIQHLYRYRLMEIVWDPNCAPIPTRMSTPVLEGVMMFVSSWWPDGQDLWIMGGIMDRYSWCIRTSLLEISSVLKWKDIDL